ncbi:MAG: glycosyltransferase [Bacteroidales bacterium]|nr:glycosyltransferase [Bacteroidales bacterium]
MTLLAVISIVFLGLRLITALINLAARTKLKQGSPDESPTVSVLIPARDEEHHITSLLEGIITQEYAAYEVIVYDDESSDGTAQVVEVFSRRDSRVRLVRGGSLPGGWLGKTRACDILAKEATGDYLLFLDADVTVSPGLLKDSIAYMNEQGLELLSVFPVQRMETAGEKTTVPLMNWILLSLLPLPLTRICKRPSLSAANGQFMCFRSETYHRYRFHERARLQQVEDIRIMKDMKKLGLPVQTLLSGGQIACRMYGGFREAVNGFAKNMPEFFGGNIPWMLVFVLFTTFGAVPVAFSMLPAITGIYLLAGIALRIMVSLAGRQPVWQNLLYALPQQLALPVIAAASIQRKWRGWTTWKGRMVRV